MGKRKEFVLFSRKSSHEKKDQLLRLLRFMIVVLCSQSIFLFFNIIN